MNKRVTPPRRATARAAVPPAEQMMFSLVHAARGIEQRLEAALEEVGLSAAKFAALTHLVDAAEPLGLGECAARMTCVRSNITQLMDRLEAEGLVRRIDDPADRRGVKAVVTALGAERQAKGAQQVTKVQKQFAKTLADVDQDAFARALAALR
jgi:DNA-binding MarR family transcriptional regulator